MRKKVAIVIVLVLASSSVGIIPITIGGNDQSYLSSGQNSVPVNPINSSFAFVSIFSTAMNYTSYGWKLLSGDQPLITTTKQFNGQPALELPQGSEVRTTRYFTPGDRLLSFQFALSDAGGTGVFSIVNDSSENLVSISIHGETVQVTSGNLSSNATVLPSVNQSDGWVFIQGTMFVNLSRNDGTWFLEMFSGSTASPLMNVSIGNISTYAGIKIVSLDGTTYFSNIIFTSDPLVTYQPGYNSMEGYGQGSGDPAQLLGPFTIMHANVVVYNWSSATFAALSLQINALNYEASINPTAQGFFQVGVDLDPAGSLAPWYVGGSNAVAIYFPNNLNPDFMPGFSSPNGTRLSFTIQYLTSKHIVRLQIIDYSVSKQFEFWNATVEYQGSPFYAAYTQLELSASSSPDGYSCSYLVYNMTYGNSPSAMQPFPPDYELPYSLNSLPNWYMSPYNDTINGYSGYL
ncbi:MAG: hypothetical protein QXN66_03810 [Thermoplasmatales archaeon]